MKITKEYYLVNEISRLKNMTARNVRTIINSLDKEKNDYMVRKSKDGVWEIHHLMLPKFDRKRIKESSYYALTIDPLCNLSKKDISTIMDYVFTTIDDLNLEINYVIDAKVANGRNHIHAFVRTKQKQKLISMINLCFSEPSYKLTPVFDLEGWKSYITKNGVKIITLARR
jgi:ankyrin repeat protein